MQRNHCLFSVYISMPAFADVSFFLTLISPFSLCRKPANTDVYGLSFAPRVGLEPTTTRLTAECSTIELSRISQFLVEILLSFSFLRFALFRLQIYHCSTIELSRIIFTLQSIGTFPYPQNRTLNYLSYLFAFFLLTPFPITLPFLVKLSID